MRYFRWEGPGTIHIHGKKVKRGKLAAFTEEESESFSDRLWTEIDQDEYEAEAKKQSTLRGLEERRKKKRAEAKAAKAQSENQEPEAASTED